jgi:hypothetical protein
MIVLSENQLYDVETGINDVMIVVEASIAVSRIPRPYANGLVQSQKKEIACKASLS